MASFFIPARRRLVEASPTYYPFGGKLLRNALQDYKGSLNSIKILFLECHDLRNVLQTIATDRANKDSHLTFYLNHQCLLSFARNVLILKVISSPNFNPDNIEDFDYLWDLWYNLEWPNSTLQRFLKDVKSLHERGLPENCFALQSSQVNDLKEIFLGWQSSLTQQLTNPVEMKALRNERLQYYNDEGSGDLGGLVARATGLNTLSSTETLHRLASWRDADMEMKDFPEKLRKKLSQETKHYFESGNCNPTKRSNIAAMNPTLLEPKSLRWRVDYFSCPFDGYLPLPVKELETSADQGIAARYCQKILKNLLTAYRNKKRNVNFYLNYREDDILKSLKLQDADKLFDVIDCCYLADDVGLANLLVAISQRLELHPDALLITESFQWGSVGSTVQLYLEESLCTSLSMIPTIYGLRLDTHVELGSNILTDKNVPVGYPPVTLTWRQAPRLENMPLCLSPSLEEFWKNFEKKCFFMEFDTEKFSSLQELCGLKRYTPLTFHIVATKLAMLAGKEGTASKKVSQLKISPQFSLAQKTIEDWDEGRSFSCVITTQQFSYEHEVCFAQTKMLIDSPWLRIIVAPVDKYHNYVLRLNSTPLDKGIPTTFWRNWATELPFIKFIDNFELNYRKKQDGSLDSVDVKFFLPEDHGLANTHCALLIDMITGIQIMCFGMLKDCVQIIIKNGHSPSKLSSKVLQRANTMQAVSCFESEKDFEVKIDLHIKEDPKGLKITTNQQLPCQAAHKITFSLDSPKGVKQLTLCFPYPVLPEHINATLSRSDRSIGVVLKKALLEPWPCQFKDSVKWKLEKFIPWTEPHSVDVRLTKLMVHLAGQMEAHSPVTSSSDLLTPLEDVRRLIMKMLHVCENEYFIVTTKSGCPSPFFHFRAHPPILTSPSGTPILVISAVDHCLSEKLVAEGKLKSKQFQEDFKRIYGHRLKNKMVNLEIISDETADLLRYVLRLNSTKMIPTAWQQENLPLSKSCPYLATFLSPLYLENVYPHKNRNEELLKKNKILLLADSSSQKTCSHSKFIPTFCTFCGKQSKSGLKRCSQCLLAYYCNANCQRAHWKEHKAVCAPFK